MIWSNTRPPDGVIARDECIAADEITRVGGIPVTTRERTAIDLGRHLTRNEAVARLDALMWNSTFAIIDVMLLSTRYRGARGLRRLREALPLVDGGAASPRETRLRLLFIDAGLPRPTTQIPVVEEHGRLVRMLDMGWEDFMVGAEYEVMPKLKRMGWDVIRVINEDRDEDVIARAWSALTSRGWRLAKLAEECRQPLQ